MKSLCGRIEGHPDPLTIRPLVMGEKKRQRRLLYSGSMVLQEQGKPPSLIQWPNIGTRNTSLAPASSARVMMQSAEADSLYLLRSRISWGGLIPRLAKKSVR